VARREEDVFTGFSHLAVRMSRRCMLISTEDERSVSMGPRTNGGKACSCHGSQRPTAGQMATLRAEAEEAICANSEETGERRLRKRRRRRPPREQPSALPTDVALLVRANQDGRKGCFAARSLDALLCLRGPGVQERQVTVAY